MMIYVYVAIVAIVALVALFFFLRGRKENFMPQRPTIAKFYSDGCGHCRAMKQAWGTFADANQKSKILIVSVNANDGSSNGLELSRIHNVRGLPTILYCPNGLGVTEGCVEYNGDRSAQSLQEFHDSHL